MRKMDIFSNVAFDAVNPVNIKAPFDFSQEKLHEHFSTSAVFPEKNYNDLIDQPHTFCFNQA